MGLTGGFSWGFHGRLGDWLGKKKGEGMIDSITIRGSSIKWVGQLFVLDSAKEKNHSLGCQPPTMGEK